MTIDDIIDRVIQTSISQLTHNEGLTIDWGYVTTTDSLDFIVRGKNYSIKHAVSKFQIEQCHNIAEMIIKYITPIIEKVKFMDKGYHLGFVEQDSDTIKTFKTFAEGVMSTVATPDVAVYLESHLVFAGGAFTSVYHGDEVKDFDIFVLKNNPQIRDWIGQSNLKSPGRFTFSETSYLRNKNINIVMLDNSTKVQYIFTHYKTREELIDHFDLEHTCVSYHMGRLYVSALTLDCIKRKKLKSHNRNKPDDWRIDKFMKRGFTFESNSLERI